MRPAIGRNASCAVGDFEACFVRHAHTHTQTYTHTHTQTHTQTHTDTHNDTHTNARKSIYTPFSAEKFVFVSELDLTSFFLLLLLFRW